MTTNILDPLAANLDRRQLLVRALFGSVGAAAGLTALPSEAEANGRRRVVFDLAILGHTFTTILAPGATDTDPTNLFGSTVVAEGALYRGGTIPRGAMNWDLASATPIGHWFLRGFYITRTGRPGEEDRTDPVAIVHSEYIIGRITPDNPIPADQLTTSHLASPTTTGRGSVVGGTGRYFGARGEVFAANIGSNITGVPNFVLDFRLEERDR